MKPGGPESEEIGDRLAKRGRYVMLISIAAPVLVLGAIVFVVSLLLLLLLLCLSSLLPPQLTIVLIFLTRPRRLRGRCVA